MAQTRHAKPPRPPSRSRFLEGSMNDRTSTAPPLQYIGASHLEIDECTKPVLTTTIHSIDQAQAQQHEQQQQPPAPGTATKRGSKQLLGQVWEGVRDKFRSKRDKEQPALAAAPVSRADKRDPSPNDDRPSKEEIYANYQNLMASGFFTSHAIQSTRQPAPGTNTNPVWPLPQRPTTPSTTQHHHHLRAPPTASPVHSPASASSRGTKRAATLDDDELLPLSNKKLRKAGSSRDIAMPKLRSSTRLAQARSFSNARTAAMELQQQQQQEQERQVREPNKLTKRVLKGSSNNPPVPVPVPERGASRRNFSDILARIAPQQQQDDATTAPVRVLRPRRSAADHGRRALRVKPSINEGIPGVPDIPPKFTYGEDRENDGPWRALRRAAH
ncbi:uncharacterized protein F5Z01DRAFT_672380 [Emericellopsis atlantica]|uniref:Uncharacterized protein n=1 Tax=Emericellopsis atlantica TaxID=2614577 RepID=A0A9P8CRR5_9HYPO|nr:uncharacterized protein F5Z01DRAFT_672380 [Emericellopsis atlantica]KAG9256395.1 hypothetical protein F5Z01DRAFT_672380 [Emericellopsis atlantica]